MTTIYVCTHKDFTLPSNLIGNYKIVTDGIDLEKDIEVIKADNKLKPLKKCYSELFQLYTVWKTDTTSDYIGLNHYRRYFDVQFHEEVNEDVLPPKMAFDGVKQYRNCHNVNDLEECLKIIEEKYGYDTNISDGIYPCNMFILSREHFNDYCSFLFDVLEEFANRRLLYTDEDVKQYVSSWTTNVDYQSRLFGFLAERISTIYFNNKLKSTRHSSIKLLNNS